MYAEQKPDAVARVNFPNDQCEQSATALISQIPSVEGYESGSEDNDREIELDSEELIICKPMITMSRGKEKVGVQFDV